MSLRTVGDALHETIYAFVYGLEGSGKTLLPMTLAKDKSDTGVAYISPEAAGVTSLVSMGYSRKLPFWLLPPSGQDPFPSAYQALQHFQNDSKIHTVVVDGISVMCGRAVDFRDEDKSGKIEWDDWAAILSGFRRMEGLCEKLVRGDAQRKIKPKSVILTAWERPPKYEPHPFNKQDKVLVEAGRPLIQGEARTWLPGNCDIVTRITSGMKSIPTKVVENGKKLTKMIKKYNIELQVYPTDEWIAKTRWKLPDPCPADLRYILNVVNGKK